MSIKLSVKSIYYCIYMHLRSQVKVNTHQTYWSDVHQQESMRIFNTCCLFSVKLWGHKGLANSCLYSHSNLHSCSRDSSQFVPLDLSTEAYTAFPAVVFYSRAFAWVYNGVDSKQEHIYSLMQNNTIALRCAEAWWSLQWTSSAETLIQFCWVLLEL